MTVLALVNGVWRPSESEPAAPPIAQSIKWFLDGLRTRPVDAMWASPEAEARWRRERAWQVVARNVAFALTYKHRFPPKLKARKAKKYMAPLYIDANGKRKRGFPPGAYLRCRTEDAMVFLSEVRENGASVSLKMYGPFDTADAQREFMRSAFESSMGPGPKRDEAIAQVMAWRRFDE
jgi:hypothetical protein